MKLRALIPLAALTLTISAASAADWPQYRGPNGDGSTPEALPATWPAAPKVLWKVPGGTGFSSFIVSGKYCFTIEGIGSDEVLVARNTDTGKELWKADLGPAKYQGGGDSGAPTNKGGDGPRSTPTLAGKIVVAMHSDLTLHAFDGVSGKPLWKRDFIKENAGHNISWSNAASPLFEGGLIYVAGGGAGQTYLAIDPAKGTVVMKAGDDTITHATPTAATILGQRQIIFFMKSGLTSLDPKTLKQLWHADFPFNVSTAASPVVAGDYVYCSAGYNVGAAGFKISRNGTEWKAEQVMRVPQKPLANHWSTPVFYEGYLYGMFQFKEYGKGPVKCEKLPDGDIKWEQPGFGPGQIVLTAGGNLLALSDAGELVGIKASPDAYRELGRFKVIDGKCWTTPVLSNGRVFVRSTKEAACIQLGAPTTATR
ncbi:MAG: PQQ-binding-like beta-propeller repeat protein [Chthoniobacteraceae bacterium]